ncbi:MAG: hypothetical protein ABI624_18455 [Casimicrobiaceae bacterium]
MPAGFATEVMIQERRPALTAGDMIVDAGNAHSAVANGGVNVATEQNGSVAVISGALMLAFDGDRRSAAIADLAVTTRDDDT